jgi:ATP-dependent helicase/nuclease subunit B
LPELAKWILRNHPDPISLSNLTILLPSRRSCFEIKNIFLKLSKNEAVILPKILAIGDVDYELDYSVLDVGSDIFSRDLHFQRDDEEGSDNNATQVRHPLLDKGFHESLSKAITLDSCSKIEYQLELILAIKEWNQKTNLFGKNISTASLALVADNLQSFLDEVEKEGVNLDDLAQIDDGEMASHKQQILQFLQYFSSIWQNSLLKKGLISDAKKRNLMLNNFSNHLQKNGSKFSIIAAGSTGSVFAASKLLKTIADLENGSVVLFGLDQDLDDKIWEKISENHPQFMLKKLIERLGIVKNDVKNIGGASGFVEKLCSRAMLPADFIDGWKFENKEFDEKKEYLKIETENEFDEAKIIAFQLREILEEKGKTAALISNDKNINQLVKANLSAWQIEIDDSSSSNLAESEIVNFLFLISEFVENDFSALNLLSILKHPLASFRGELLRVLEMDILRDVVKFADFDDLILNVENDDLKKWLGEIADILKPLIVELGKKKIDFRNVVRVHFECFEGLSEKRDLNYKAPYQESGDKRKTHEIPCQARDDEHIDRLPVLDTGSRETQQNIQGKKEFLNFINEISNSKVKFECESESYNRLLQNFLKNYQYRKTGNFHPRLQILSTMEARLMSFDLVIVAGLCEGSFPSSASEDWLGSKIRNEIGMPTKSRKIGIESYDFCNYLGGKKVVLFYPKSQNNSPTIKSRFLLKLETILKINGWNEFLQNGEEYLEILKISKNDQIQKVRANPKPSQNLTKISATDISKWMRNPYSIYAKRILKLKPLKKIEQEASFAEFGNFVHKSLEEFIRNYPKIDLTEYAKKIFSQYFPDNTSRLLWWPKFENIAEWFIKQENIVRGDLKESFVEVEAEMIIQNVILSTKIDRINLYQDGSFEIIDYKTGQLPKIKEIESGIEPQLAVEAFILSCGEIKNYPQLNGKIDVEKITNLQYQNLKGNNKNDITDLKNSQDLIDGAEDGIFRILNMFADSKHGYVCAPNFDLYKQDDYWHLGRIEE